jgi:hypothetical protein
MGDGDGRDGRGFTGECSCLGVYAVAGGLWVDAYEVYACKLMGSARGKRGLWRMRQLFYKTGLMRVVIASANLVSYDWEFIENVSRVILLSWKADPSVIDRVCARYQPGGQEAKGSYSGYR